MIYLKVLCYSEAVGFAIFWAVDKLERPDCVLTSRVGRLSDHPREKYCIAMVEVRHFQDWEFST